MIETLGGEVTLEPPSGQESYTGSLVHGILTSDYGPSDVSFIFLPNQ